MGIITGGNVIGVGTAQIPGSYARCYYVEGVPTDANIGSVDAPTNGMLAENVLNGNLYERQAAVWVRVDTL
jgi:hypothetical protein